MSIATILVLEDDDVLRELVAETLTDEGYKVIDVGTPEQALEMASLHRFQVFLTDVRMAGRTDGVGVLEQLKALRPSLKTIIMTGYADTQVPLRAMKLQADDYLLKGDSGFGMKLLLETVARVLQTPETSGLQRALDFIRIPLKLLAEVKVSKLEAARSAFFSHLFLGIRPAFLSAEDAFGFWLAAEELEKSFHRLNNPAQVAALTEGYTRLSDRLLDHLPPPTVNGDLTLAQFRKLYERVRQGGLQPASLQAAALLRTDEKMRKSSVEHFALYCELWGEKEAAQAQPQDRVGLTVGSYRLTRKLESVGDIERYQALDSTRRPFLVEVVSTGVSAPPETPVYREERDGRVYVVLPWRDTVRTLRSLVLPAGRSAHEVVTLLRPIFELVHQAHQEKRFDGALSPHRVLLTGEGPRVPDFGHLDETALRETAEPLQWQNLPYIDPQLFHGRELNPTSDHYSLGVIAVEMWTGIGGLALCELLGETQFPVEDPHQRTFDKAVRRLLAGSGRGYVDLVEAYGALAESVS